MAYNQEIAVSNCHGLQVGDWVRACVHMRERGGGGGGGSESEGERVGVEMGVGANICAK